MKFIKQNDDGKIIIDGEGEHIEITRMIPADSPVILQNCKFFFRSGQMKKHNTQSIVNCEFTGLGLP